METFQNKEKCEEMRAKSEAKKLEKELAEEQKKRKLILSQEEEDKLWIRDDLKNTLAMKNSLYVIEILGEPDERRKLSNGNQEFIYHRPISRYSKAHDPDVEIRVSFVRGSVSKVYHIPPSSTPDRGWNFRKKL